MKPPPINCPKCNAKRTPGTLECHQCGVIYAKAEKAAKRVLVNNQKPTTKKKRPSLILLVGGAFILFCLVIAISDGFLDTETNISPNYQKTTFTSSNTKSPKIATPKSTTYYFDSRKYCKDVSAAVGGSYQIEQGCMTNERTAKQALNSVQIEAKIVRYCKDVSNAVGGSYQIMYGCIMNELEAKRQL